MQTLKFNQKVQKLGRIPIRKVAAFCAWKHRVTLLEKSTMYLCQLKKQKLTTPERFQ